MDCHEHVASSSVRIILSYQAEWMDHSILYNQNILLLKTISTQLMGNNSWQWICMCTAGVLPLLKTLLSVSSYGYRHQRLSLTRVDMHNWAQGCGLPHLTVVPLMDTSLPFIYWDTYDGSRLQINITKHYIVLVWPYNYITSLPPPVWESFTWAWK